MSLSFLNDEGVPGQIKDIFGSDYLLQIFRANSNGEMKEDVLIEMDRLLDLPVEQRNTAFEKILSNYIQDNKKIDESGDEEEIYF